MKSNTKESQLNDLKLNQNSFSSTRNFAKIVFKHNKVSLIIFSIISIIKSLESIIWAIPVRHIVIALTNNQNPANIWETMKVPFLEMIAAFIFIDISWRASGLIYSYKVKPSLEYFITNQVSKYILLMPYSFFTKNPTSIANRIYMLSDSMSDIIIDGIDSVLACAVSAITITITLMVFNLKIGLITSTYLILHLSYTTFFLKKFIKSSSKNALSRNILVRKTLNMIHNISNVKSFSNENYEVKRLNILQERKKKINKISLLLPQKIQILFSLNNIILIGLGLSSYLIYLYKIQLFSIGDVTYCFSIASSGLIFTTANATFYFLRTIERVGESKDCLSFFHTSVKKENILGGKKLSFSKGKIRFNNVTFQYPNSDKNIFEKFNVTIEAKQKVGLVGLSGSGKSTFTQLIMNMFHINKGRITIDNKDIKNANVNLLRDNITLISQDCSLFDRSIIENIKYGKLDATFEEISWSSQKAHAEEFINQLEHDYHTGILENGKNLSGGQRQRISIARAFLKNSPILILDEVTSALDRHTENIIQQSLQTIMQDKTVIAIAHKLETVLQMDRILVFKDGKVIEDGTHTELIADKKSYYYYLWQIGSSNNF